MARVKSNLAQLIERAGEASRKRKDEQGKLKVEIYKLRLQHQMAMQKQEAKHKQDMTMKQAEDRAKNPQKYTPEQQYLRRRFREENPLAAMAVPEEGQAQQGGGAGIGFPTSEVTQQKGGRLQSQPIGQERQAQLLMNKVDQMKAAGKSVHPAVLKIVEKMRGEMTRKQGLVENKEEIKQMQKRLKALNIQISYTPTEELKVERDTIRKRLNLMMGLAPLPEAGSSEDEFLSDEEKAFRQIGGAQPDYEGDTVTMIAPDGSTREVPADRVEYYKGKGAKLA